MRDPGVAEELRSGVDQLDATRERGVSVEDAIAVAQESTVTGLLASGVPGQWSQCP